ncbi:hypothetical protein [Lysobacter sp. HA35]
MAPRPYTATQSIALAIVNVGAPLFALWLAVTLGFGWFLFIGSIAVACVSLFAAYQTWRSPFWIRISLRILSTVSVFLPVILVVRQLQ